MAKIRDLPLGTYPLGKRSFQARAVPNGLNGFDIRIGRCTTADQTIWDDPNTVVTITVEFSFDNQATWEPQVATFKGGIVVDSKTGIEYAESICGWRFSPNQPTHLRGSIEASNAEGTSSSIKTYVDVAVP